MLTPPPPPFIYGEDLFFKEKNIFIYDGTYTCQVSGWGTKSKNRKHNFFSQSFGRTTFNDKRNQVVRAHFTFYYD